MYCLVLGRISASLEARPWQNAALCSNDDSTASLCERLCRDRIRRITPESQEMEDTISGLFVSSVFATSVWVFMFRPNRSCKSICFQFAIHYLLQATVFIVFSFAISRGLSMPAAKHTVCQFSAVMSRHLPRLLRDEEYSLRWFSESVGGIMCRRRCFKIQRQFLE